MYRVIRRKIEIRVIGYLVPSIDSGLIKEAGERCRDSQKYLTEQLPKVTTTVTQCSRRNRSVNILTQ